MLLGFPAGEKKCARAASDRDSWGYPQTQRARSALAVSADRVAVPSSPLRRVSRRVVAVGLAGFLISEIAPMEPKDQLVREVY
jgi:hypothetical protein